VRKVDQLEDPGIDGRIILKVAFQEVGCGYGLDRSGSGQGQVACCCEYGNDFSGCMKCGEFLY
jgi:hypothetical protein